MCGPHSAVLAGWEMLLPAWAAGGAETGQKWSVCAAERRLCRWLGNACTLQQTPEHTCIVARPAGTERTVSFGTSSVWIHGDACTSSRPARSSVLLGETQPPSGCPARGNRFAGSPRPVSIPRSKPCRHQGTRCRICRTPSPRRVPWAPLPVLTAAWPAATARA